MPVQPQEFLVQQAMPTALEPREDPKLDLAAEVLRSGGTVRLKAWGTSMLPTLWPGDLLTIESAHLTDIAPGDIVLVRRNSRFFVHRLAEKRVDSGVPHWITRGDAMRQNDPPTTKLELLGRVSGIERSPGVRVPVRRLSLLSSAVAWMLSRSNTFRSVALRMHNGAV
jgi:signal peptidase I